MVTTVPHPFRHHPHRGELAAASWLAPSLLAADAAALGDAATLAKDAGADWLHVDVMDGHFVPNLSFGPEVVHALARRCCLPLDVHLMVTAPATWIPHYVRAGAAAVTFHVEATDSPAHTLALLQQVRALGALAGLSLRPGTPISALAPYLPALDWVLVMSVEPGFGGQSFLAAACGRIAELQARRRAAQLAFVIEVDGGINPHTAARARAAGADALVAGTAFFGDAETREKESSSAALASAKTRLAALKTPKG